MFQVHWAAALARPSPAEAAKDRTWGERNKIQPRLLAISYLLDRSSLGARINFYWYISHVEFVKRIPFAMFARFFSPSGLGRGHMFGLCYFIRHTGISGLYSKLLHPARVLIGLGYGSLTLYSRDLKLGDVTRDESQRRVLESTALGCWHNVVNVRNNVPTMLQRCVVVANNLA